MERKRKEKKKKEISRRKKKEKTKRKKKEREEQKRRKSCQEGEIYFVLQYVAIIEPIKKEKNHSIKSIQITSKITHP